MKRFLLALLSVLLVASFTVTAFAHSGDTDGKGGHYDNSTGEYHYHHGYPAHKHTDIDGDGKLDCPYDFDDKTGWNSGPSTRAGSGKREYNSLPGLIFCVISISMTFLISLKPLNRKQRKHYEERQTLLAEQKAEQASLAAEKAEEQQRKFLAEKEKYTKMYGNISTAVASGADAFCYIGKDGLPASRVAKHGERWGDWFTLYVTSSGKCYHERTCIHLRGRNVREINAWNVDASRYYPCYECNPALPDMRWINEYRKIEAIRKKYDIPEP